jgi:hypothetical protein
MELIASATERTTAATYLLLACAALGGAIRIGRGVRRTTARRIWAAALAAAGLASLLGGVTHGLVMTSGLREALWQPLFLLLGIAVAGFVAGAAGDGWGRGAARRVLVPMLALALAFYGLTRLMAGEFVVFVVFQAAGIIATLVVYLRLLRAGREGAGLVAAGLAVSLAAGAIQANDSLAAHVIWDFDHNGLYHLAQLGGLALLVTGLVRTLAQPPPEAA